MSITESNIWWIDHETSKPTLYIKTPDNVIHKATSDSLISAFENHVPNQEELDLIFKCWNLSDDVKIYFDLLGLTPSNIKPLI